MQIDWWTLGIQTVNVAVLVWLLQRFFWRPVAEMIAERGAAVQKALADAKALDETAKAARAELDKARAGMAAEHAAVLQQAQAAAGKADAASLAETAKKVALLEAAGAAAIQAREAASEQQWADRSRKLAVDIAGRLASRLDGKAVQQRFLDWMLDQLRALPQTTRLATDGAAIEAVTATSVDEAHTTQQIAEALGTSPHITYRIDASLIAGLELHGAHLDVTNSWKADLAGILVTLQRPATP